MSLDNRGPSGPKGANKSSSLVRTGRDEMNLAEYAAFSMRNEVHGKPVTERKWMVPDPHFPGKEIEASWRVAGDPELGRPTATDVKVYLVMLEMTREAGWTETVEFSTLTLIKKLGWSPNSKHYKMLRASFARLKAVDITARNCFWDNKGKVIKGQTGFSIIDNYHIDETRGRKNMQEGQITMAASWWKWNEVILNSMLANYVKPIDLGFALSLERPLSLALFRYLDKKRYTKGRPKPVFSIGIKKLCDTHLQLSDTRHFSTMKRTLTPAHEELIARGFLLSAEFAPMKQDGTERVIYRFSGSASKPGTPPTSPKKPPEPPKETTEEQIARIATEAAWREKVFTVVLQELQAEDPEDYQRIYDDAVSDLGEMDIAILSREPSSAPVLRTIRENMWAIVELEYPWSIAPVEERLRRELPAPAESGPAPEVTDE